MESAFKFCCSSRAAVRVVADSLRRTCRPSISKSDLKPDITLGELMAVVRPALSAVNELGQPDWSARLCAVAVLLLGFPRYLRASPEHVRELLERVLPKDVPIDKDRIAVESYYRALRREWWSLPAHSKLRGLVPRELPRNFVEPWRDYSDVLKAEMPTEYKGETFSLPDGQTALRRPGQLPVVLEEVEDESGGLIRAVSNV